MALRVFGSDAQVDDGWLAAAVCWTLSAWIGVAVVSVVFAIPLLGDLARLFLVGVLAFVLGLCALLLLLTWSITMEARTERAFVECGFVLCGACSGCCFNPLCSLRIAAACDAGVPL